MTEKVLTIKLVFPTQTWEEQCLLPSDEHHRRLKQILNNFVFYYSLDHDAYELFQTDLNLVVLKFPKTHSIKAMDIVFTIKKLIETLTH